MRRGISVDRVCLFSSGRKKGEKKMNTGLIAIFILLVIIVGAIATRRCVEFLIGGSLLAAIFMYGKDFLPQWCTLIQDVLAENVWIVLVCGLFRKSDRTSSGIERNVRFSEAGFEVLQY